MTTSTIETSLANPANAVTLARALGAAALLGLALTGGILPHAWAIFGFALGLALLDGIDGWVARALGVESRFGARFDMETDAFFILVLACATFVSGKAGAYVFVAGLARYLFVLAGWWWRWLAAPLPGSLRRKALCVAPTIALIVCLSPVLEPPASHAVALLGVCGLVASFLTDTVWLYRNRRTLP